MTSMIFKGNWRFSLKMVSKINVINMFLEEEIKKKSNKD